MGGKKDEIKGRIKEAAGTPTGNDQLREEGMALPSSRESRAGRPKAADTVKDAVKK